MWSGQARPMMQCRRTFHRFDDLLRQNKEKKKRNKQQIKIITHHRP
jgi:hypothetical protein